MKCQECWVNGGKPAYKALVLSHHQQSPFTDNGYNFAHIQAIFLEELCQFVKK